jgi:hypothetical protein
MQPTIRNFDVMLKSLERGKFAKKCDEVLSEVISTLEALPNEKGKAKITLEIEFSYQSGLLNISPSVKPKLPEGDRFGATPFWIDDGALSVEHPNQRDMFAGPRVATDRDREAS